MAIISCTRCGAETEHTAKFCRKCGNPVNMGEATTKSLDAPVTDDWGTRHVNAAPTTPSYLAPGPFPPMAAPSTQNIERSRHKWTIIGLATLVVILIAALAVVLLNRGSTDFDPDPMPPVGGNPPVPGHPPLPPPPPPPGARGQGQSIATDLIYPGAQQENVINAGPGGVILKLQTTDPVDKVFDWYEARLKDNQTIRKLPGGVSTITSNRTTVIIKSEAGTTSIVITRAGG